MRKIYLHKRFDSFNLVASTFEAYSTANNI